MARGTNEILRHFPTLLKRWHGSLARTCEMTKSLRTLRIRLEHPSREGSLEIACIGPTYIEGPVDWEDSNVQIDAYEDGFIVRDESAGVRILAEHVELAENRKPPNA